MFQERSGGFECLVVVRGVREEGRGKVPVLGRVDMENRFPP